MARVVWAIFCEHQTTDADGKNSYIGIFDNITISVRAKPGAQLPQQPLSSPVPSFPFVLALKLKTKRGAPLCTARLKDPGGQEVFPPIRSKLTSNASGNHNWHLRFPRGIPVRTSGAHTFQIEVEGEAMRQTEVELPIKLDIQQSGGSE